MEEQQIQSTFKAAISKILKHEDFQVNDQTTAQDVGGWDSLSHMMIISEIEKAFNVRFKLKELNKLKTLNDLYQLTKSKL